MKRGSLATRCVCIAACLQLAACGGTPKIPVAGEMFGQHIETTVDSDKARYYVESYLSGKHQDVALSSEMDALHRAYERSIPSREDLRAISQEFSVDLAALFFAHRLLADECNATLNQAFATHLNTDVTIAAGIVSSYVVLFVPGWDYAANGHATGADFARPRELASEFGLENHLVELPPTGSVEQNANVLASMIAKHNASGKKLILAAASSAGPAVHLALGELLGDSERRSVKAWLNLGGILQGSPLVDFVEARPWLFNPIVWFMGWDKDAIRSMATKQSRERFSRLPTSAGILVVNYLGVPLSGQLSRHSRDKYPLLRSDGPNDGLTLLADVIAPDGLTIVAMGSDHFFAEDPRINEKTVALMKLMLTQLESDTPRVSGRCSRLHLKRGD